MLMGVDEAGGNDAASGVYAVGIGPVRYELIGRPHFGYVVACHSYSPAVKDIPVGVHSHHIAPSDDEIWRSRCLWLLRGVDRRLVFHRDESGDLCLYRLGS